MYSVLCYVGIVHTTVINSFLIRQYKHACVTKPTIVMKITAKLITLIITMFAKFDYCNMFKQLVYGHFVQEVEEHWYLRSIMIALFLILHLQNKLLEKA